VRKVLGIWIVRWRIIGSRDEEVKYETYEKVIVMRERGSIERRSEGR
jgi:hypothetical protein